MNYIVKPSTSITPYSCSCKGTNFGGSNSCSCDTRRVVCSCNTRTTPCKNIIFC